MKTYQAALFDMDGVVADTNQTVRDFWFALAAREDVTLSEDDFKHHIYGCPATHTLAMLFPRIETSRHPAIHDEIMEYERSIHYRPMPGVIDLLRAFKRQGIPTALVTSGRRWRSDLALQHIGIADLFSAIVTVDNITRGKPDPESYLLGAQLLKTPADACLVFEDAVSGIRAGVAAGATCIGIQDDSERAHALSDVGAVLVAPDFRVMHLAPLNETRASALVIKVEEGKYARFPIQPQKPLFS